MGMPNEDIASFIDQEKVDFASVFSMVDVNGPDAHPLYTFLKTECPGCISWNFCKFLVSKTGKQIEKFNHLVLYPTIESEIKKLM